MVEAGESEVQGNPQLLQAKGQPGLYDICV